MPRIRSRRAKKRPDGWELIEPVLIDITQKIKDIESEDHEGKRKPETLWPIYRLHHARSRYIYDMFYKKKEISKQLYLLCLKEKWADANLIAKWKKNGF